MTLSWEHTTTLCHLFRQKRNKPLNRNRFPVPFSTSAARGAQSSPRILCADDLNVIEYNLPEILGMLVQEGHMVMTHKTERDDFQCTFKERPTF